MRTFLFLLLSLLQLTVKATDNEWLKHIATTTRVSAQHYSEMVCDDVGNVYIASYVKDSTRRLDFIYIVKISPNGEKVWEKGIGQHGRAVSISIDNEHRIWVTGYFVNRLILDDKRIKCNEAAGFIAVLDTTGTCIKLKGLPDGTDAHNIHVNTQGEVLVTGNYREQLKIDKQSIESSKPLMGFISILNYKGECIFLSNIQGNIFDIVSDEDGSFYLTGNFADEFEYENESLYTQDFLDKDGFVMKVDNKGKMEWLNQFGKVGAVSAYYTSHDAGCDLAIQGQKLLVPVVEDSAYGSKALYIHIYDNETGERLVRKKIVSHIDAPGAVSIEAVGFTSYLTFLAKDYCTLNKQKHYFKDSFKIFVLHLNEKLQPISTKTGLSSSSFMIRESTSIKKTVYFSGHYKKAMSLEGHSLKTSYKNSLFLYKSTP